MLVHLHAQMGDVAGNMISWDLQLVNVMKVQSMIKNKRFVLAKKSNVLLNVPIKDVYGNMTFLECQNAIARGIQFITKKPKLVR